MADRHLIIPRDHPELPTEHGNFNVQGPSFQTQNGLRDPFVLDVSAHDHPAAEGRWLFYAAAGEFALGVTQLPAAS